VTDVPPSPESSVPSHLLELAPTELPRSRSRRYTGEGFAVTLLAFPHVDAHRLQRIYGRCHELHEAWLDERESPGAKVRESLAALHDPAFLADTRALGESLKGCDDPRVRSVLHDALGGALSALIAEVRASAPAPDALQLGWLTDLARDHAKVMRQAIVDIDPEGRSADEEDRRHGIAPVVARWTRSRYRTGGAEADVRVDCRYEGDLASRCLEAAAIDRILYNLLNNATRFADDGRVHVSIFPVGEDDVRFVVDNTISADQALWLSEHTERKTAKLFEGDITRGGDGIGLANCASLVAAAYGQTPETAVERGHLGAEVRAGHFLAWFHWPALAE